MAKLYTIKVKLLHISKPPVWRRITIPDTASLENLHYVIQDAFGWENAHLYSFSLKGYGSSVSYGEPQEDSWDDDMRDASKMAIGTCLNTGCPKIQYIYDFGDDWIHELVLEGSVPLAKDAPYEARCIAGKGMCPAEDCGGPYGWEDLKAAFAAGEEDEKTEWARDMLGLDEDEPFDPKAFDLEEADEMVQECGLDKLRVASINPMKNDARPKMRTGTPGISFDDFMRLYGSMLSDIDEEK